CDTFGRSVVTPGKPRGSRDRGSLSVTTTARDAGAPSGTGPAPRQCGGCWRRSGGAGRAPLALPTLRLLLRGRLRGLRREGDGGGRTPEVPPGGLGLRDPSG